MSRRLTLAPVKPTSPPKLLPPLASVMLLPVTLVVPPTVRLADCVMLPVVFTVRLPPVVVPLSTTGPVVVNNALPVAPLVLSRVEPVTVVWSSMMSSLAPEVLKTALPPTVTVPESVRLPVVAVADRFPPIELADRVNAVAFTKVASPVTLTPTVPVTAKPSSVAEVPVKPALPPTVSVPPSVITPADVMARLPVAELPFVMFRSDLMSLIATFAPPLNFTSPVNELEPARLMSPVAVRVDAPPTDKVPDCVIAPTLLSVRLPETADVAKAMPSASVMLTLFPLTIPTDASALPAVVSVMSFAAPAVRLAKPPVLIAPVCVIAPFETAVSVPVAVVADRLSGALSVIAMFAPLAFVLVLQFGINRLSTTAAQGLYWAFCVAMGASLTNIFLVYTGESVRELVDGIAARDVLRTCDAVLSGYMGDAGIGSAILHAVERVRAENPAAVYCCDPVIGDTDTGVYVRPGIEDFIREQALPAADIATPNRFERLPAWPCATRRAERKGGGANTRPHNHTHTH